MKYLVPNTLLSTELQSIQNPVVKATIERGFSEATTDEDFSSLLETFHLLSSPANAKRLVAALERSQCLFSLTVRFER
ncbi:MAG: hypothetical protein J0L70_23315 [Leptolyngbya sp. UWPOB_LEPTO1]|uniref:hypothetical protein n=1 Tax=Leptolyngbya sp. UWPOB_LEPTO1 TaxID=2815653 RepID=UPI001AC1F410|nr:hypothetical protein [Leptolyngbya sp. UWPOB_LEPTO1]MBN8563471.1 hypothetical protein [Leptolyngbya sp. UWPOB_LEPTO1]